MLEEAERFKAAAQFADYRLLPRKDEQGLDYTQSVREVSAKNALETLVRHFTDDLERKREATELTDIASQQLRRAEDQSIKARDYSVTVDRILGDYCRAAGVSSKEVAPSLSAEEIALLRDFSDRLSAFSGIRKVFTEAARMAEDVLQQRQDQQALRESQRPDLGARGTEHSPSQVTIDSSRSDRDTFSRGR
jgi:hypothetical protein